ncbi:MAG: hypothetical protein RSC99_10780, partial [Clostridiales bacterium]
MHESWRIKTLGTTHGGASSQAKCFVFTKQKIIWYQQTWHTIEFSNNRRFQHPRPGLTNRRRFALEQLIQPNPPRVEEQIAPNRANRPTEPHRNTPEN